MLGAADTLYASRYTLYATSYTLRVKHYTHMARRIAAGIDVGTQQVKVVITKNLNGKRGFVPALAGVGLSESKGLRHGYIINHADTMQSISTAIEAAEKA